MTLEEQAVVERVLRREIKAYRAQLDRVKARAVHDVVVSVRPGDEQRLRYVNRTPIWDLVLTLAEVEALVVSLLERLGREAERPVTVKDVAAIMRAAERVGLIAIGDVHFVRAAAFVLRRLDVRRRRVVT